MITQTQGQPTAYECRVLGDILQANGGQFYSVIVTTNTNTAEAGLSVTKCGRDQDSLFLSGNLCNMINVVGHSLNIGLPVCCDERGCKVDLSRHKRDDVTNVRNAP